MKVCKRCNLEKPLYEFYKHNTNRDGLSGVCKSCVLKHKRKKYWEGREKKITLMESRLDRKVCTCCNVEKNIIEFGKNSKEFDGKNKRCKECVRNNAKVRYDTKTIESKIRILIYTAKYQRRLSVSIDTEEASKYLYTRFKNCEYCGIPLNLNNVSLDHITPIKMGGSRDIENIQLICFDCNRLKFTRTDTEFRNFLNEYTKRLKTAASVNHA